MARLGSGKSTRKMDGACIEAPSLNVYISSKYGARKISGSYDIQDLGWVPLSEQYFSGAQPSIVVFRQSWIPATFSASGSDEPADIVNINRVADIFRPKQATTRTRIGFSKYDASASNSKPTTAVERVAFRQRLHKQMIFDEQSFIDLYDANCLGGEKYLGRYWLLSIGGCTLDGALLTFADARFINFNKPMMGRWIYSFWNSDRQFSPDYRTEFNAGGNGNYVGNQNSANVKNNFLFTDDFRFGSTVANWWSIWDMLQYLFAQDYVFDIETPTLNDNLAFHTDSFDQYPDLDITGMTITEALDAIIRSAGDYNWTIVPTADGSTKHWKLKIYEYSRWEDDRDSEIFENDKAIMVKRNIYLPAAGATLANSDANIVDLALDENIGQRTGHMIALGEHITVETTFSTDGNYDYSCQVAGPDGMGTPNGSGVATMEWVGNLTGFAAAYNAAIAGGASKSAALATAMRVDENAYRVCALKITLASTANPKGGYAFIPADGTYLDGKRRLLPYRLPRPLTTGISVPADSNERPNAILWVRKPTTTTWYNADTDKGRAMIGGSWSIDPEVGGVRFAMPLCVITGTSFDTYDLMLTAALDLDERLRAETYRKDWTWKTSLITPPNDKQLRYAMRWNALIDLGTNYTEIVIDNRNELRDYATAQFGRANRNRISAQFTVDWPERIYTVGDWLDEIHSGSGESTSLVPVGKRELGAAIVGVEVDYQNMVTRVRCENWRQE